MGLDLQIICLVGHRHQYHANVLPSGCYRLLLDAANAKHLARQRHLARHRHVGDHGHVEGQAQQGCRHADAGRGPILGRRTLGQVHVHACLIQEVVWGAQLLQEQPSVGQSDLTRLAHNLPEPARHPEARAGAGGLGFLLTCTLLSSLANIGANGDFFNLLVVAGEMAAGLDEECLATHSSPSQTHDHARGHAIVEHVVGGEGWLADELFQVVQGHDGKPAILLILADKGERGLTGNLFQQFPEFSDARLPGVVPDEQNESLGAQIEVLGLDAMCVHRLWYEELVGDGHLLLKDITGQPDDLHSIQQRPRNRVCDVGRANEQCLGQVHRSVQVQIAEGRILSRIEDLQQGRGRIAAEVSAQLVDLVDQDHRVANLCDLQRLNYLPRHRSHIRAPVPADFCNVVQTTYREAEKLPIQRPRDALPDGSLSCTRWPDQTHDLPLGGPFQEAHGHMFKDPFLDILQTIMVLVEHCLRLVDICVVRGVLAPRKHRHPVQVCPAHIEFRRLRLQTRQPAKFVLHSLSCLFRNTLK
mmetsp:Transcript_101212/g.325188  ORF Transcript_101212/g.325188 Transcript_101212/m.325188 type:complete len:529 (-) Transcript_101212:1364-2950(-)